MALETLADLGGRSYLSDMTIHHNSANRSNCIDKGANLENLETTQNTPKNPIPNQATQNLNSLLAKDPCFSNLLTHSHKISLIQMNVNTYQNSMESIKV